MKKITQLQFKVICPLKWGLVFANFDTKMKIILPWHTNFTGSEKFTKKEKNLPLLLTQVFQKRATQRGTLYAKGWKF